MRGVVPFVDLKLQYQGIKEEIMDAVGHVLETGQFVLGEEVSKFEKEFAAYVDAKHAIALNTGTSGLHLALLAAGIGPGDEVITVPFTFVATAAAIRYTGAVPVFVDIDLDSYTMDPAQVEKAITPRTKAICPVHLYGQAADLDPILDIAKRHGLKVIEDACQAHGTEYNGPSRRCDRRRRCVQLLPWQEPRRLRRRRHGRHERRRSGPRHPDAPRLGRGEEVPTIS